VHTVNEVTDKSLGIRHAIQQNSAPLKEILQEQEFCKYFGKFDPASGARSNVFGHSDALKTAPRGVAKDHPDIELLKLRSVAAVHTCVFHVTEFRARGLMS